LPSRFRRARRRCSTTALATISSFPPVTRISTSVPGSRAAASRSVRGMTIRPARSIVDLIRPF
jgi:hypothetical protein